MHKDINKLIDIEGQLFDELMRQEKIEEAIAVVKRQLDLFEQERRRKKTFPKITLDSDIDAVA